MLLAIDIGNSNIVIGGIQDDRIAFEARIATDHIKTSDQYGVEIKNILSLFDVKPSDIDDCIISSVVPPVFNSVRTGVVKLIRKQPMVVGPGIKTGLNIQMDAPAQVGSDRIVIAVAALAEYEPPLTLLDLGTATTIEVVDRGNTYVGGCIIPGVRVSLEALTSRTAQLPGIRLDRPKKVIGGLHAQRHHVRHRRHAGRDAGPGRGGTGLFYHRGGHRRHGAVYRPPVPQRDDTREGSAAEGVEYPLQKESPGAEKRRGMR